MRARLKRVGHGRRPPHRPRVQKNNVHPDEELFQPTGSGAAAAVVPERPGTGIFIHVDVRHVILDVLQQHAEKAQVQPIPHAVFVQDRVLSIIRSSTAAASCRGGRSPGSTSSRTCPPWACSFASLLFPILKLSANCSSFKL